MDRRVARSAGTPRSARIEPSPSACSVGSSQAAERLGEVRERVGALVAVGAGVGQRADAARVDHEHERPSGWRGSLIAVLRVPSIALNASPAGAR